MKKRLSNRKRDVTSNHTPHVASLCKNTSYQKALMPPYELESTAAASA
jgi:hypothetical protein